MRFHPKLLALGVLVLLVAAACRDAKVAPTQTGSTPTSYVTFTLDTLGVGLPVDVANSWGGLTLLQASDQSVHIIALDPWSMHLRYHGCANACDLQTNWIGGSGAVTTNPDSLLDAWSSAVLTASGIQAVYSLDWQITPNGVWYARCPGACSLQQNWTTASLFVGTYSTSAQYAPGQSTSLAVDSSGGLHLLLRGVQSDGLFYAFCGGSCDGEANWQVMRLNSVSSFQLNHSPRLIAFDTHSGVHVLYATSAGLTHASCSGNCASAGSWQLGVMLGGASPNALSLTFGADGRLYLAYADGAGVVNYATCAAPCGAPGSWSAVALPLHTTDVSLATNRTGSLFLATSDSVLAVSRCDSGCLAATAWHSTVVTAALGGGHVAMTVDSAGHARVASTVGFPNLLQYTQMLQ